MNGNPVIYNKFSLSALTTFIAFELKGKIKESYEAIRTRREEETE